MGTERKHFLSFCRLLPLLQGAGVCFLRSNGELGKYIKKKRLIKENYTRNQRGSFPIGPMLTRSVYVYVIKTQIHSQRPYCQPAKTHVYL